MSSDAKTCLLALNVGSSSLKFAIYSLDALSVVARGQFERVGQSEGRLVVSGEPDQPSEVADHADALAALMLWLDGRDDVVEITAIGHRIVHGGPKHRQHCRLDDGVLADLVAISDFAPEHLPAEISVIHACRDRFVDVPQFACFDTAFHRTMPLVARQLPLPRRLGEAGVERYGFHGLSCDYVMQDFAHRDPELAQGRVVLAHIGNGVSLTALDHGQSIETTMGFTPAAGVPMGTRSGDIDPGLVRYLAKTEHMDDQEFDHMINHQSGLLGVSGVSSDVRDLLAVEAGNSRAAEALALFCYRLRLAVGSLSAALGGLDALIFTGGVGENASAIRQRICADLGFLGVELDEERNRDNGPIISSATARVAVRVIPTDEEAVIASATIALLKQETFST